MWQTEQSERRVSSAIKWYTLAKGRKTPTEIPRAERGLFRHGEVNPPKGVHPDRKTLVLIS
jgi:hypothetical protein